MAENVSLVLVGAKTYMYRPFRSDPIVHGEEISVGPETAEYLRSLYFNDKAGGRRYLFVPPDDERAVRLRMNMPAQKSDMSTEDLEPKKADDNQEQAPKATPKKKSAPKKRATRARSKAT